MELKQFINTMMQSRGLRALLPVSQGLLYPCFTTRDGMLCAHFLANSSTIQPEGMVQYTPITHVTALFPGGAVVSVENLKFNPCFRDVDFTASTLIPKRSPEEKQQARENMALLTQLVNQVLTHWEETGTADTEAYHRQLSKVLLPQQWALYQRVMGW